MGYACGAMSDVDREALRTAASHPALRAVRLWLDRALDGDDLSVAGLDRLLANRCGIRFEVQPPKRRKREPFEAARSYDGSITLRGVVPSREGSLHDLMNALAWAAFPRSKRAMHARQLAALTQEVEEGSIALPGRRSRLRDRLSMLDEGGVLLTGAHPLVLGHAVTEQVVRDPERDIRTCVVPVTGEDPDAALAERLTSLDDGALERWIGALPSGALRALWQ
jgi:hypothetical protein